VLSHHPDGILQLTDVRRIDAVFAGHTHGGQIVLPGYGAPLTLSRVCTRLAPSGWVPNARAPLYVSRGIGLQIPIRIGCPSEVAVARLRARA
jgi:predicted MPP superfamily phosphohydrolase